MRKMFCVLFCGALLLLLTGCGRTGKQAEPIQITVWHYYNNAQLESFQKAVARFNETVGGEKNITVTEKSLGYVNDLASSVVNSAKQVPGSAPLPDMFMAYSDTAYLLDTMGYVAELDDYFTADELAAYYPGFLQEGRFGKDGKLKTVPVAKSLEALYIDTTDFERFMAENPGVSYDSLRTVEGIIDTAKIYYTWSGGKAFYGRDSISNYCIIGARQLGIDLFDYDADGRFVFNADKQIMRKLFDDYYVPLVSGYFSANGKFRSSEMQVGSVICYTGSTASCFYFPKEVIISDDTSYPIGCKVMAPPAFADAPVNYTVSQGAGFVVTKNTKEKEAACVTFLKWIGENSAAFSSDAGYLPVRNDQLTPALYEGITHEAERQSFEVALQMLDENHSYTPKASLCGNDIRNLLDRSLNDLAAANKEKIAELEAGGLEHGAAVARFTGDDVFESWYDGLLREAAQYDGQ